MTEREAGTLGERSAAGQLAGYIYQVGLASAYLFDLEPGQVLGIESLDDLHVEGGGQPTSLLQPKHHLEVSPSRLTDASPDLWKPLDVWTAAVEDKSLDLDVVSRLVLITTSEVPPDTLASAIESRADWSAILQLALAVTSSSAIVQRTQARLKGMAPFQQEKFIHRLIIKGGQPGVTGVPAELRVRLRRFHFPSTALEEAADALQGWVFNTVVERLKTAGGARITEDEFHAQLVLLRDRFTAGGPRSTFYDPSRVTPDLPKHQDDAFVRQLSLVKASERDISRAVTRYLQAYADRSRWISEAEVLPEDLDEYDHKLVAAWQSRHEVMCDRTEDCDEDEKCRHGLNHYHEIEGTVIPIRPAFNHPHLTVGSYHMLADDLRVGWHPRYRDILQDGTESRVSA